MKETQNLIRKMLKDHKRHKKWIAVMLSLSMLILFLVPLGLIMPAVSMSKTKSANDGRLPANAYDFENRITGIGFSDRDGDYSGGDFDAGNADSASVWFQVSYDFQDTGDISLDQPYIYLTLPKDQIKVMSNFLNKETDDTTADWIAYRNQHGLGQTYKPATYSVYPTDNENEGLVVIHLKDEYINYIKENNNFQGALTFEGSVDRASTQSGDVNIKLGDAEAAIKFADRNPSVKKSGSVDANKVDENGVPYIHWTITVSDLYELNNYTISDTKIGSIIPNSFVSTPNMFYLDNGAIKTDLSSNNVKNITIEYDTLATTDELEISKAENTVTISGPTTAEDKGEVNLNSDIKADVYKSGIPSYEIADEKGFIYWTVKVSRKYGMNLNGYTLTDTMLSGAVVSAVDKNGNNISDKITVSGSTLTFANDADVSEATITYKSPVTPNTSANVTNKAQVTPPGGNTPDDEKEITVPYDDTSLFNVVKSGYFVEDPNGGDNDYIEWTITIDASAKNNSKETLNGYVISDEAFGKSGFEWISAEAYNDYAKDNSITNASDVVSGSGTSYTVNKNIDKLILKYKLPLSDEEKAQRQSLGVGATMQLKNNVTVTPNDGGPKDEEGTVDVPGVAGSMSIKANKSWQGNDPNRPTSAKLQLQRRVDGSDVWENVGDPITVGNDETYAWDKLPKRDNNRKNYYYRVVEVDTPSEYTPSYSIGDNGTNTDGALITVTNTWNYINLGINKSWRDINDEDKPVSVTFKVLQSTDKNNWTDTGKTITLNKADYYSAQKLQLPKKDQNGNDLYYMIEEISAIDADGNEVVSDFTPSYDWMNGFKASDYSSNDPTIGAANTWNNLNVTVNKRWAGDSGYENQRPPITLTLWEKVGDGEWTATDRTITINNDGSSDTDAHTWKNLPKYKDGKPVQYQVRETPVDNYYVDGENTVLTATGTINLQNNYSNIKVSVSKNWANDTPDVRPETVTFRIQQSSNQWAADDEWTNVPGKEDITLARSADGSFDGAFWDGLPKKDSNNQTIYYRVIEVNTDPDYTSSADKTYGVNDNSTFTITNVWNFINLTAEKQWSGDLGFEASRPDVTLTLWKKVGNGEWTETDQKVVLKNDGTGKFYEDGDTSKPVDSYTWSKLPVKEGDQSVVYKIVETPAQGYDASYSTESVNTSGTVTVTNTSNHINVTGVKQWVGDTPEYRPSTVVFELWSSITPDDASSWTKVDGAEKTITKNSNGVFSNALWARIPGKDENGHRIYYKIVEASIEDENGNSMSDEYDVSYSAPNGVADTSTITATNTWKYMNLSVSKNWSGFTEEELNALNIDEISVRLMRKIGEAGAWTPVEGTETKIKKSDNWQLENAWEKLPRKDEYGVDIYYRVEELTTSDLFHAKYDNGRNDSGTTVVTNVSSQIDITAQKVWDPPTPIYSSKPDSITFVLMKTVDGGATWTQVGEKTLNKSEDYADVTWNDLPIIDDATGRNIVYKVEEKSIDGFSVSYSSEAITETGTVTITNTEQAPYTKRALYPSANTVTNGKVTAEDYDFVSEISPERLPNLVKKIGNEEYYIFKWRLDFLRNQINGGTGMQYTITDTLPEGTVLYINGAEYDVTWKFNNIEGIDSSTTIDTWQTPPFTYTNDTITFNVPTNMSQITYYTATKKSLIDNALLEKGSYTIVNKVQEAKEALPKEATVSVKNDDTADYINKTNNTSAGTDSSGNPKMSNGNAYYTLDINKDGRFLSNGSMVNISDVFQILRYQSGTLDQSGRNILDASLENVAVYEVDSNGKRTLLSADKYSYSTKVEDGAVVSENSHPFNIDYTAPQGTYGLALYRYGEQTYPAGLEVILRVNGGTPNAEIVTTGIDGVVAAEAVDTHYDSDGCARIKITFLQDFTEEGYLGAVGISNLANSIEKNRLVLVSSILKTETNVTNNIINFTVPDGKHLQIEYAYHLKKTDNADLETGDFVTMQNAATVHASGGDQTDNSEETKFIVEKTSSTIQSSGVPKVKKIDVGNYSITDLNATFKLAKFDTESNKWIYATDFPFRVITSNGKETISKTDHTIEFGDNSVELDNAFPPTAKDLDVINGAFNIVLEENTLYKLIEIKAPDGFIKTPYEVGITQLDQMKDFTYCFIYKNNVENMSELKEAAGISDMQVQDVIDPGTVSIANIRPLQIGASKTWKQDPGADTKDISVTVQLFSSHTKSAEIPADAKPVENALSYIARPSDKTQPNDGTWILKQDYDSETDSYIWQDDVIWKNLPDGVDGKPLYYYVKEIAYNIGGVNYELDQNGHYVDGSGNVYVDESGIEGEYKPTYADNGTNNDGVVSITNSREFVVEKQWLNRDGSVMKNPPSEYSEIEFTLTGIKEDGTEVNIALGENNKLSAANGWKVEIPQYLVSQYIKFKIQEVNAPYFYIVSDVYSLNGTVGVVTLINQSQEISEIDVSVDKMWGDGDDVHTNENVEVTLYKYTGGRRFTNDDIKGFESSLPAGVALVETIDPEHPITNPITLDKDNDWSYTWTNLPYKENGSIVKYYAVETKGNEKYVSSYEYTNNDSSQHMDITNSLPGAVTIKKRWIDAEDGSILMAGVPNEVKVEIYRQTTAAASMAATTTTTTTMTSSGSQTVATDQIKLMALGDSITDGYNIAGAYRQYLYKDLVKAGYNIDMVGTKGWSGDKDYDDDNEGYSGYAIKKYSVQNRAGLYETIVGNNTISNNKPDIILLMIGTNDILDNQMGTVDGGTEDIKARLQSLVDHIYSQYSDPNDLTLFIANPTILGPSAMQDYLYNSYNLDSQAKQKLFDDNISKYTGYIKEIVNAEKAKGHDVVFVNVNSQLTLSDIRVDQIHPTEGGFEKMGKYFAKAIDAHLKGETLDDTTTTTTTTTNGGSSSETTTTTTVNAEDLELVTDAEDSGISADGTVTLNADNGWSVSLINLPVSDGTNEYIYYVKEVNGEYYEVKYYNNGQKPGSNQIITVENTTEGNPISITAEKKWEGIPENSGITHPDAVTLQLLAADTKDGTYSAFGEPVTIGEEQSWSYTWENLKGSKFYKVEETEIPNGWTVTYENNDGTQTDADVITVVNTLDKGSLELNKSWYQDNDGGTSEVEVEVWRVAEDMENAIAQLSLNTKYFKAPKIMAAEPRVGDNSNCVVLKDSSGSLTADRDYYLNDSTLDYYCSDKTVTIIEIEYEYYYGGPVIINGTQITPTVVDNIATLTDSSFTNPLTTIKYWDWGCKVKEIRFYYTPSETLEINPTTAEVVAGDTLQMNAVTPMGTVHWTSGNPTIAAVDESSGLITALKAGVVTITAKDDTATRTSAITVKPFTVNNDAASVQVTEGETVQLTANNANGTVEWSSDNESIATVDNNGRVTATGKTGKAVITADHGNGVTDTIEINVQSKELSFTVDRTMLHIGDTSASTVTPGDDVTYTVDKDGVVTVDADGTITAVGNGEATITATRGTKSSTLTIKVAPLILTPTEHEMSLNEIYSLTAENVVGTAQWSSDNPDIVSVDENGVLTAKNEGTALITLKDSTSGVVTCAITVIIKEQTVEIPAEAEQIGTFTIKKADGWTTRLEDLPLTDGNGNCYKYYIVEKSDPDKYYPISYSQNGINLKNDDVTSLIITNKSKDVEDTPVTMPETGGTGMARYYAAGITMILGSSAAYYLIRRRRRRADQ